MGRIEVVQDTSKFKWAGIPFRERYCRTKVISTELRLAIQRIDPMLDVRFYRPTEQWHLLRFPNGFDNPGTRVWTLRDDPEAGLRSEPGMWMLESLRKADMLGAASNRVEEIDAHNKAIDDAAKREMKEQCKDLASEMRKPVQEIYDKGLNA